MKQIVVGDIRIDVIRKDIRNMHLAVYPPTGRVRISAPLKVKDDVIRLFAISKLAWIKRHKVNFKTQERLSPREYKNRESHYYQGNRYLLNVIESEAPPKVVLRNKRYIDLYVRPGTPTAKRHEVMQEWYRRELKRQIPALVSKWEKKMKMTVADWRVKLMKTRWGSCNTQKKRIWINLELAKKPVHLLEYIIVHEMVHLLERHHNKKFISYMDACIPNWRQLKTELKKLPVSHAEWRE